MKVYRFNLPLTADDIEILQPGDKVLLTGTVYTARDMAHQRIYDLLVSRETLAFDLSSATIMYCGPSPTPPGRICGAIGPTTSARMDKWTHFLIEHGLRVMIGKGGRSDEVAKSIVEHHALYLTSIGGAAALLSRCIVSCETFLWPELGTEAVYKMVVKDFPAYVTIV
jgi:fumarate hydratase subunit beta